ncbi:MAG: bifunctional methylenetetrahydrofolate dehydrogenase/methenyltetrahydrofolate cyclohydrolase FolD [Planctomycetota bacterium]|nr:MAG: bifunctional methylenetetrahydrofolate dehydrogenase/methenyltetrahydrofolate cyclohydrolase FolD [Planctomycetota bacterium]
MSPARLIDGKLAAAEFRALVKSGVGELVARGHAAPGLAVVLVGDDPASQVYVKNKDKAAHEVGFHVRTLRMAAATPQRELLAVLDELNRDASVHGILVQLPLPRGLDEGAVVAALDPAKDVDGLSARSVAALWMGASGLVPCTPQGCIHLLERVGVKLEGARAVVIGRSQLVGKPLAALLLARHATVTIAHSRTQDLAAVCREADVLVAAVGKPELVRGAWIKPGAAVIDVGINRLADGRLVGDVAFAEALEVAGCITPVPGGVGPMTIAMLLGNTLLSAARRAAVPERELAPWRGEQPAVR